MKKTYLRRLRSILLEFPDTCVGGR
ncbi:hypothetical protein RDI58_011399 [Solanum bulbocastanum]|uniref:Uncharacterized protein n=1 Tax=Solanum bulbocastanum TaxID=147425 RepID=A0AAN8TPP3_SOLBU